MRTPTRDEMERVLKHANAFERVRGIIKHLSSSPALDDELYREFRSRFPTVNLQNLTRSQSVLHDTAAWSSLFAHFDGRVAEPSLLTVQKLKVTLGLDRDNLVLVCRLVWMAIEVCRLRETRPVCSVPPAPRLVNVEMNPGPAGCAIAKDNSRPPTRAPRAKRRRVYAAVVEKTFLVSRRLYVPRRFFLHHFNLPSTATDEEVQARADMLRNTMMDYGDVYEWAELLEYLELRQVWPALYDRWVANKDHKDGTEWAVFDKPGKIEFVRKGGDIVTDSLAYPNEYALGLASSL